MDEKLQTILVTVFSTMVANGAIMWPILRFTVVTAWNKSIEWRDMVKKMDDHDKRLDKIEKDLLAAHNKIRELKR